METGTPSIGKVVTMVLFALSCVGLLLFLWLSFGGTIPFNPKGYRVQIAFPNAGQLATQADVRIAGVNVGKVVDKQIDPKTNRTIATIQLQNQYVPLRQKARAILRLKTIIGETYVELTPGPRTAKPVPDGGMLPTGQVQPAVQLDEVFNTFEPSTRRAFQQWQQALAQAINGNDQNLNSVLGNLPTFAADTTDILNVLDIEHAAVVRLLQNGGTVFSALSQNQTALRNLITTGEATFNTTAANNNKLAQTFHVFPTFLNETKATMARLQSFATDADPLIKALQPVAVDLKPTLNSVSTLSPYLRTLFNNLGPLVDVSQTGLPAIRDVLHGLDYQGCGKNCLLGAVGPFLEQLNPVLSWLSLHQQLISDFISNGAYGLAAKTTSFGGNGTGHYLRQFSPVGPETLSISPTRDASNRGDTYPPPLWLANPQNFVKGNFPSWDCNNTGGPVSAITLPAPFGREACWVAPKLPGAATQSQIPHITAAHYSSK